MNSLSIHVSQQSLLTRFSTNATLLVTTKESTWKRLLETIDPDGPSFDLLCNADSPLVISAVDSTTKSGPSIIDSGKQLLLRGPRHHGDNGSCHCQL